MPDATRLMTVFEAMAKRRAVRAYRPDVLDEGTVRELLREAVRAPTAMHAEPWLFAIIQDRALLKKYSDLAKATWSPERDGAAPIIVGVPREEAPQTARKPPEIVCWHAEGDGRAREFQGAKAAR